MSGEENPLPCRIRARLKPCGHCLIPGRLYVLAGGAYPGLYYTPEDPSRTVIAELLEIQGTAPQVSEVLHALDRYEGSREYLRRLLPVKQITVAERDIPFAALEENRTRLAWVYILRRRPAGRAKEIPSGAWQDYRNRGKLAAPPSPASSNAASGK
ncbi:MAG: gamma-glutamylcyclotransferase [Acidobacteriia bacterium]|nr:gamma-glutamylcyclotransferase [Methyloceanibacter sp.]MCL6492776.1 gamma-glutamylcyclotransferase [Terriglobia bacterium]